MELITLEQLEKITSIKDKVKLQALFDGIKEVITKYSINTTVRLSHFLAQIMHESADFTAVKENLNYSAKALLATWPKRFTKETALSYERKPEKIGNKVYADRMGNGNEASGDGFKFRGRGYLQITGKINYIGVGKALGIDLINHPELLESPRYAILSAGWWWNDRKLNDLADKANGIVKSITQVINGGQNGANERQANFHSIFLILNAKK